MDAELEPRIAAQPFDGWTQMGDEPGRGGRSGFEQRGGSSVCIEDFDARDLGSAIAPAQAGMELRAGG